MRIQEDDVSTDPKHRPIRLNAGRDQHEHKNLDASPRDASMKRRAKAVFS